MSQWKFRVAIIVPAASKPAAEQAARAINSTGPDYEGDAFTVPLSADGSQPPTHYGLYMPATSAMVQAMGSALPQIEGTAYWRHGIGGILQASNATEPAGQAWGWEESLSAAGLVVVETPKAS